MPCPSSTCARPSTRPSLRSWRAATLAVLPTGSGKSAIYQVAGLSLGGLTLVISPLMALQRDQLRSIAGRSFGAGRTIDAEVLSSSQKSHQRHDVLGRLGTGELDFLLIGPEQFTNSETRAVVRAGGRRVGLFVVDEAHLVSEWGQEFRPEYLRLVDAIAELDRPNISLAMRQTQPRKKETQAVEDRCIDVLIEQETRALVYALTHARCEALAERLRLDAFRAAPYHGGLPSPSGRTSGRACRCSGEHRRLLPGDRARRPGRGAGNGGPRARPAHAPDTPNARCAHAPRRVDVPPGGRRDRGRRRTNCGRAVLASRLDAVRACPESTRCRRAETLAYFGESDSPPCNNCDNDRFSRPAAASRPTITGGVPVRHRLWGEGQLLSRETSTSSWSTSTASGTST